MHKAFEFCIPTSGKDRPSWARLAARDRVLTDEPHARPRARAAGDSPPRRLRLDQAQSLDRRGALKNCEQQFAVDGVAIFGVTMMKPFICGVIVTLASNAVVDPPTASWFA